MLPALQTAIPGPRSLELATRLRQCESRNVTCLEADFPIFWERAAGTSVWDVDGNQFLDLTAGFAVTGLGHTQPEIVAAMRDQAGLLYHAMGDVHPTEWKVRLCEELSAITFERWQAGRGKTILASSGSEAVEAALKTSLLHSGKRGVIAFDGGYHGLGYGALETSGMPWFRNPFRTQLGDFATLVPFPDCCACPFGRHEGFRLEGDPFPNCSTPCLESIAEGIEAILAKQEIGCILVEPCQGRAGEIFPPRDFLPILRRICDEHKILLILDEIYTGFNRTGKLFACEHFGVIPDLICLGKGLTSGFPLSACVGRSDIMDAWPESTGEALHTSTFLGNPLGCRMALESIRLHRQPETLRGVVEQGKKLKVALLAIQGSRKGHISGTGLMLGVEIIHPTGEPDPAGCIQIVKRGLQDGLLFLGGGKRGNILSLTPPFAISDDEIAFVAERLTDYLRCS